MKNLLLIFIIFCFISPAFAEIQPPQWNEFCPEEYLNAQYISRKPLPSFIGFVLACSIVGAPIAFIDINKQVRVETNNYWVRRREAFNLRIKNCKQYTDYTELMYCYLTERQKQAENDANLRMSNIEAQQRALAVQQNIQRSNMQSQINNIQTQNQFNKIRYGY